MTPDHGGRSLRVTGLAIAGAGAAIAGAGLVFGLLARSKGESDQNALTFDPGAASTGQRYETLFQMDRIRCRRSVAGGRRDDLSCRAKPRPGRDLSEGLSCSRSRAASGWASGERSDDYPDEDLPAAGALLLVVALGGWMSACTFRITLRTASRPAPRAGNARSATSAQRATTSAGETEKPSVTEGA